MDDLLPRLMEYVRSQPWALMPEKLAMLADIIAFRNSGGRLSREEIVARIGERAKHEPLAFFDQEDMHQLAPTEPAAAALQGRPAASVIAVLGVLGIISQRAAAVDDMSGPGGTSTERLAARFRAARDDAAVKAIVLDVDSPGGGVYGVQELASEILDSRGVKPVVAVANSLAASAAYWLASAADQVSVTPSGVVGSIGVYAAHEDLSGALEKEGVKVTLVSSGKYKTEGSPFAPLTEEAMAYMQSEVDRYKDAFVGAVAKGRGVSRAKVEKDFGQGRTLGAQAALDAGMVDRIETLDQTISRVAGRKGNAQPVAARSYAAENAAAAALSRMRTK
jgi:signal peptide peptidase SppA